MSNAPWISVAQGQTGIGDGTVRLVVAANSGGSPRSGTVTIAGQTFTVRQQGASCAYAIKPPYYNAGRGPDDIRVDVMTDNGCAWTAASPVSWATIEEGRTGTGNGTVRILVEANNGPARNATLTIAGESFALAQNGCAASIKPASYNAGKGADDIKIRVSADDGCSWTASSPVSWAQVVEGQSGSGDGEVRVHIEPNNGPARSATLTIAGQAFALHQKGSD
jgi:hypothetical protein